MGVDEDDLKPNPDNLPSEQVDEKVAQRGADAWGMVLKAPAHRNPLPTGFRREDDQARQAKTSRTRTEE